MTNDKFRLILPIDIQKSEGKNGNLIAFRGIASIQSKDSSGETIDLNGADLSNFSMVNWNHGKGAGDILGQIDRHELRESGTKLYVEGSLYGKLKGVKKLVELEKAIKDTNGKLQLAMSVEGKTLKRDEINPKRITHSRLSGLALTYSPVHKDTNAELILKSFDYDPINEIKKSANGGTQYILDVTNPTTGMRTTVDMEFNVKVEKAITTTSASALLPESVGKKLKPQNESIKKSLIVLAAAKKEGSLSKEILESIKKSNISQKIA